MGIRPKPPKHTNPLLSAAAALTRATDPPKPSRLTVFRLLADAHHLLHDSHLALHSARAQPHAVAHVDAEMRLRHSHNDGARALFSVAVSALIKLPSRAGPLRRQALDLVALAARATGPASAMAAVDRVRSHISSLKRLSWSDADPADFHVSAAILTLADLSVCPIASRDVARESILFLLSPRIRQKCRRADLTHALALILASFPHHMPPDDRLLDQLLDFSLSSSHLKHGLAAFGGALLVAVIAPFLVTRGPAPADDLAHTAARALKVAPTPTERAMWALAVARAVLTARRSTTYQLRKYGNSDMSSKFPKGSLAQSRDSAQSDDDPSVWVSNEIFEQTLLQVAQLTSLPQAAVDASIAVASVIRMWYLALPQSLSLLVPRTLFRLTPLLTSVRSLSTLVDAMWLGLLKDLTPSHSSTIFESIIPLLAHPAPSFPVALTICAALIRKFGRQTLRENGLSTDYNTNTSILIKRMHDSLASFSCSARLSGARVMSAILFALPRSCSQLLTAVLQNLRIADMTLASKPFPTDNLSSAGLSQHETELAPVLGNAAALSLLVEKIGTTAISVPAPLYRQCAIDILALLRPNPAGEVVHTHSSLLNCVRRRMAWGLVAASARGKRTDLFEGDSMALLLESWTEELKYNGNRANGLSQGMTGVLFSQSTLLSQNTSDGAFSAALEETLAVSSTRAAALYALNAALRNIPSPQLEQCVRALVGASAGRLTTMLSSISSPSAPSGSTTSGTFVGFGVEQVSSELSSAKRRGFVSLARALAAEASQLVQVIAHDPPSGDSGELCFYVAMALAEESQRALGEYDAPHVVNGHFSQGQPGSDRLSQYDSIMSNHRDSLLSFDRFTSFTSNSRNQTNNHNLNKEKPEELPESHQVEDADMSWLYGLEGVCSPLSERTLIHSAKAIAAVVSKDLSAHGSLIESLPTAKLSPTLCAAISLEMTKRLSLSDLAEINRALAVLQVLVRRSLWLTGGAQRSISSQVKVGRLYTPSSTGDGHNFRADDLPGAFLQQISQSGDGLNWVRKFSDESHLGNLPFHNFHTRALGMTYATRLIASEAYRELSVTGGPTLWAGLMRKVISSIRDNIQGGSPSQFINVSNAITTLGALLEVIPEPGSGTGRHSPQSLRRYKEDQSASLKDIADEAIGLIASAIETGRPQVQAAAALALSSRSYLVASHSERLTGALLRAWAQDKGEFGALGHFGRCSEEVHAWHLCFTRAWSDMGVKEPEGTPRFYLQDSSGLGSLSSAFAIGTAGILGACRLYWWPLSESSFHAVKELAVEMMQWEGDCSHQARTTGLLSMVSVWSTKIDRAHAKLTSKISNPEQLANNSSDIEAVVAVDTFSLRDQSRASSQVGPFLDEVVYDALAPKEGASTSCVLRMVATSAVSELIRGIGVEETCLNLPRLPESLFAAVELSTPGAQSVMEALVSHDARKRPRYWFGLCRAVALGGDRLNHGKSGATWDVSYKTKAFAVRIAVEAVDSSLGACTSFREDEDIGQNSSTLRRNSAYGFLRKIFDFVKQVSSAASRDFESCGHGCRLLQRVASRLGDVTEFVADDPTLTDFLEMWDPCVAMMHTLLTDRVPHGVVNSAATALSELLVCSLKLQAADGGSQSTECAETVSTYMQALMESDLRQRLKYADQGEEIGLHALLALVGKYGRIMSSLKSSPVEEDDGVSRFVRGEETMRRLFFALTGDFVSSMDESGLRQLALDGGSLTPGQVREEDVRKAMEAYIAPIILGSVSCIRDGEVSSNERTSAGFKVGWENADAVGVVLAESREWDTVAVASLVWVLKHEQWNEMSIFKRTSLCNQLRDCLDYLFRMEVSGDMKTIREEVLLSFAKWNKSELLKFAERTVGSGRGGVHESIMIVNVVLSVLMTGRADELGWVGEEDWISVCRGLRAVRCFVSGVGCKLDDESRKRVARDVLDVILGMAGDEGMMGRTGCRGEVQDEMFDTVEQCVVSLDRESGVMGVLERRIERVLERGEKLEDRGMMEMGIVLAGAVSLAGLEEEVPSDFFFGLVLMEDGKEECTHRTGMSRLGRGLGCRGVEECVVGYIEGMSGTRGREVMRSLGRVGGCAGRYDVGAALRCAEAAVVVEGEGCEGMNKMGMVLYCMFLRRLIRWTPYEDGEAADGREIGWGHYVVELAEGEVEVGGSMVSSLGGGERERARKVLQRWG